MTNAFAETRKLFTSYTNYTQPLSYDEWSAVADENKATVLFVQFYDEITLAWYKTKSFFVLEEDGVSTILQYLVKNVPIIQKDSKKFTPNYIYRVAYNCLYCISHDIKRDIERWERETSNIVGYEDRELDLFDSVAASTSEFCETAAQAEFWRIIESMGPDTLKVVNYLLNEEQSLKKARITKVTRSNAELFTDEDKLAEILSKLDTSEKVVNKRQSVESSYHKVNNYELDPLKDIEVSLESAEKIIDELRIKLEKFKELYYI